MHASGSRKENIDAPGVRDAKIMVYKPENFPGKSFFASLGSGGSELMGFKIWAQNIKYYIKKNIDVDRGS